MKAIMIMFDSLNRHTLPPYGGDWIQAPNFTRLADHTVTFTNSWIGSMPCMPARRELHTGRHNFLHRSWGPLEPFDDSMPERLKENGIYTHLVTDHQHYWEDGGATYHSRYNSFEFTRGQEGDRWKGHVMNPKLDVLHPSQAARPVARQDMINRSYIQAEEDFPQARTFAKGLHFIETNAAEDGWFLQLETFDPHEPFFAAERFRQLYAHEYDGPLFDWPKYGKVTEAPEVVQHLRYEYAALVSMCDAYLGRVLDLMDRYDLWQDTLLIVNTDHGFLLGEHDWWAKCAQPFYNEVARTPLFIWDPRCGKAGDRNDALVQTVDLAPTLLDYFGIPIPQDMTGQPLRRTIEYGTPVREAALFGIFGGHVNCTDGRYVYMRAPVSQDNQPLFNYTLMPAHMRRMFSVEELAHMSLAEPFPFTKGLQTLRIPGEGKGAPHTFGHLLFDLQVDPQQQAPIEDPLAEARMLNILRELLHRNEAPQEQFSRLGIQP
jgi:arylsulfatase A-like enzyme